MEHSQKLQEFLERKGKRGEQALKALAEIGVALKVIIDTPLGKQLLDDDINRFEELLMRIASGDDNPEFMPELKYLYRRLEKVVELMKAQKLIHEQINKGE